MTTRAYGRATTRPMLLDLFCGAGGAAMGYWRAGFEVVGVDIRPQPRYPFRFVQGDALTFLAEHGADFDAIHASPPCQRYSRVTALGVARESQVDLVEITRSTLRRIGRPYIIENVECAPLVAPVLLCGTMFGLRVYRHRLFESSELLLAPEHHRSQHRVPAVPIMARDLREAGGYDAAAARGWFFTVASAATRVGDARAAMGIPWMLSRELSQAIPPAYTEFLGAQLIGACRNRAPALRAVRGSEGRLRGRASLSRAVSVSDPVTGLAYVGNSAGGGGAALWGKRPSPAGMYVP